MIHTGFWFLDSRYEYVLGLYYQFRIGLLIRFLHHLVYRLFIIYLIFYGNNYFRTAKRNIFIYEYFLNVQASWSLTKAFFLNFFFFHIGTSIISDFFINFKKHFIKLVEKFFASLWSLWKLNSLSCTKGDFELWPIITIFSLDWVWRCRGLKQNYSI